VLATGCLDLWSDDIVVLGSSWLRGRFWIHAAVFTCCRVLGLTGRMALWRELFDLKKYTWFN
jgi:hypothetical protein